MAENGNARGGGGCCSGDGCCGAYTRQCHALVLKNALLVRRRWSPLLVMMLFPLIGFAGLWIATNGNSTQAPSTAFGGTAVSQTGDPLDTPRFALTYAGDCRRFDVDGNVIDPVESGVAPCIPVLYTPDDAWHTDLMSRFTAQTGVPAVGVANSHVLMHTVMETPGRVEFAVAFVTNTSDHVLDAQRLNDGVVYNPNNPAYGEHLNGTFVDGPQVLYTLWFNDTSAPLYATVGLDPLYAVNGENGRRAAFQIALESALLHKLSLHSGGATGLDPALDGTQNLVFGVRALPELRDEASDATLRNTRVREISSTMAYAFPLCVIIGVTVAAMGGAMGLITYEKQQKLLGTMRQMGLIESVFWCSWLATFLPFLLIGLVLGLGLAYGSGLWVFTHVTFGVHVVSLLLYALATLALVFFLASFLTQDRWVNVASFLVFFLSIGTTVYQLGLYGAVEVSRMYDGSNGLSLFFSFFAPWIHYARFASDVTRLTTPYVDNQTAYDAGDEPAVNPFVSWSTLQNGVVLPYRCDVVPPGKTRPPDPGCDFTGPAPLVELGILAAEAVFFFVLAWYCSQVFAAQGITRRWYFCVQSSYWGCERERKYVDGDTITAERLKSAEPGKEALRLHKLSKSYDKVTAVKEVSLQMLKGEITALLGHNGAGKTSILNVLTGLYDPTHGEAFAFGLSVRNDMPALQRVTGVCPQHNTLWDHLTAREHIELFARFKNAVPAKDAGAGAGGAKDAAYDAFEADCDELLKDVNLHTVKGFTHTFSGGMKRRLHVALAFVGRPKLVFCDEPTTGMDPVHRRGVWEAIEKRKRDCVLLLTTHSMEEADALGDSIAIMALGRLRAKGTSLFLKHHFGAGYQINLLTNTTLTSGAAAAAVKPGPDGKLPAAAPRAAADAKQTAVEQVTKMVSMLLPGAEILGNEAGAMTIALPRKSVSYIPAFFKWIQKRPELVKEWGLSDSTLEEVFLRLAAAQKDANADIHGFASSAAAAREAAEANETRRICLVCQERPCDRVTLYTAGGFALQVDQSCCLPCSVQRQQGGASPAAAVTNGTESAPLQLMAPTTTTGGSAGVPATSVSSIAVSVPPAAAGSPTTLMPPPPMLLAPPPMMPLYTTTSAGAGGASAAVELQPLVPVATSLSPPPDFSPAASAQPQPQPQLQPPQGPHGPGNEDGEHVQPISGPTAPLTPSPAADPAVAAVAPNPLAMTPVPLPGAAQPFATPEVPSSASAAASAAAASEMAIPPSPPRTRKELLLQQREAAAQDRAAQAQARIAELQRIIDDLKAAAAVPRPTAATTNGSGGAPSSLPPSALPPLTPSGVVPDVKQEVAVIPLTDAKLATSAAAAAPAVQSLAIDELDAELDDELKKNAAQSKNKPLIQFNEVVPTTFPETLTQSRGVRHTRALLLKDWILLRRQYKQNVCLLLVLLVALIIGGAVFRPTSVSGDLCEARTRFYQDWPSLAGWNIDDVLFNSLVNPIPDIVQPTFKCDAAVVAAYTAALTDRFAAVTEGDNQTSPLTAFASQYPYLQTRDLCPGYPSSTLGLASCGLGTKPMVHSAAKLDVFRTKSMASLVSDSYFSAPLANREYDGTPRMWLDLTGVATSDTDTYAQLSVFSRPPYRAAAEAPAPTTAYPDTYEMLYDRHNFTGVFRTVPLPTELTPTGRGLNEAVWQQQTRYRERAAADRDGGNAACGLTGSNTPPWFAGNASEAAAMFERDWPDFGVALKHLSIDRAALHVDLHTWFPRTADDPSYNTYPYARLTGKVYYGNSAYASSYCTSASVVPFQKSPYSWYGGGGGRMETPYAGLANVYANALLQTQYERRVAAGQTAGLMGTQAPRIRANPQPLPPWTYQASGVSLANRTGFLLLFLFVTLLLFPWFVVQLVTERETKLFHMLRISGVSPVAYWSAAYLHQFRVNVVWGLVYVLFGWASGSWPFVNTNPGYYVLVLCVVWNHASIGVSVFLSSLVANARSAATLAFGVMLATIAGAGVLATVYDVAAGTAWPLGAMWIPPLAYARAMALLLRYGGAGLSRGDSELSRVIGLCFGFGSLCLVLGWYLSTIRYRHPLWFLHSCRNRCSAANANHSAAEQPLVNGKSPASAGGAFGVSVDVKADDPDVVAERDRVAVATAAAQGDKQADQQQMAVCIHNLTKVFAPTGHATTPKVAVNHLSLGVEYGSVLALLGTNGAGKTTTIDILSGLQDATSGVVRVAGCDVSERATSSGAAGNDNGAGAVSGSGSRDELYTRIAVCPQFETVWDDLTVKEHFEMYARIRGCPPDLEAAVVTRVAEAVELDGDSLNVGSGTLSGGQKRRLSIGISLVGNPRVWLLDECTTGLDPETRRTVWRIVQSQRNDSRATIITTHSMVEADALATRIAIMKHGRLEAIGPQLHLKNRFGEGFKLTVQLPASTAKALASALLREQQNASAAGAPGAAAGGASVPPVEADAKARVAALDEFVRREVCASAVVQPLGGGGNAGGTRVRTYVLPVKHMEVAGVFNAMNSNKERLGIREWGFTQASLEDVFVKVARDANPTGHDD